MRVKSMLVANDRNSPDQLTNSEAGQMLLGPESKQPLHATIHCFSRTHNIYIHSIVRSHPPVAACSYSATCTTDPSAGLEDAIDRFPIHTAVVFTSQLLPAILKQQASVLAAVFQTFAIASSNQASWAAQAANRRR